MRPERLQRCCDERLQRLQIEHIELYQSHALDPKVPLADQIATLAEMQESGKIRFIGVSNGTLQELEEAWKYAEIVSMKNPRNVGNRRGNEKLVQFCEKNGLAFIPHFPIDAKDLDAITVLEPNRKSARRDDMAGRARVVPTSFVRDAPIPGRHRSRTWTRT